MTRLKAGPGGIEFEWGERLDETEQEFADAVGDKPGDDRDTTADESLQDLLGLARSNPAAAILMSFQRVETELRSVLRDQGLLDPRHQSMWHMVRVAGEKGVLTRELVGVLDSLRLLRNKLSHSREIEAEVTVVRAVQYVLLAKQVITALQELHKPD